MIRAYFKKERLELIRSHKLPVLLLLSVIFGIMSPFIAVITPWMLEMMSDQMAQTGLVIDNIEVNALTSWMQFFKNFPMFLLIFVLMFSGILINEIQDHSLVLLVIKGLKRNVVFFSKWIVLVGVWTLCYGLIFIISYGYTLYLWGNGGFESLALSIICPYLFGIFIISLIFFASVFSKNSYTILIFLTLILAILYFLSIFPTISEYLPVNLLNSSSLLENTALVEGMYHSLFVCVCSILILLVLSSYLFGKRCID